MRIFYDNIVTQTTSMTPSSTKAGTSILNLVHPHLSRYFAFNGNTGTIVIDFGVATEVSNLIIGGTNITDGYSALILEGNTTNSWDTAAYLATLDRYSNGYVGKQDINETYQYWRLTITDSNVTDVQLGHLFMGAYLQMPGIDPAAEFSYNDTSAVDFSVSGQSYGDTGFQYFTAGFKFPMITDFPVTLNGVQIATREDILVFWKINQGVTPIYLMVFENDLSVVPPLLGLIAQRSLVFKLDRSQGYYTLDFKFQETK